MASNTTFSENVFPDQWADYSQYHNSSHERGFVHSATFGIFLLFCNFVLNGVVILLIMWRLETRSQYIYSQIVNLAVSDISYGLLVDTVTVYYEFEKWQLGKHVCKAWMILDIITPFTSLIIIIIINIDRLIFALRTSLYYKLFRRWVSRAGIILFPWIFSSVVLTPIWLLSSVQEPYPEFCIYGVTAEAAVASSILSIFLPASCLVISTVFLVVTVLGGLPDEVGQFTDGQLNGQRLDKRMIKRRHRTIVTALCFVNICSVSMQLPYEAIALLQPECMDASCTGTLAMMQALSWMRSASPGIRPLFWILITEIRHASMCCACSEDGRDVTVAQTTDQIEMASAHTAQEHVINSSQCKAETSVEETLTLCD